MYQYWVNVNRLDLLKLNSVAFMFKKNFLGFLVTKQESKKEE